MAREVMEHRASDNEYFHPDFHGALSTGIEYLDRTFGEEAVREYLRRFTNSYYAPLKAELRRRGLAALKEHFEKVYAREGGEVRIECSSDELIVSVAACPAIAHMRRRGYRIARLWRETTRTVNEALCEGTPFEAELLEYDERTGRSVARFRRRA